MKNADAKTLEIMRDRISGLFDDYAKERTAYGRKSMELFCFLLKTYQFRLLEKALAEFADANRSSVKELQEKILEIANEKDN